MPKVLDVEAEILELLKNAKFGYSVSKIADILGYSRTTISKYLQILEDKSLIFIQDVGQYKLWHHSEGYYSSTKKSTIIEQFFQPFYRSLMDNLKIFNLTNTQVKTLGKKISQDLNLGELSEDFLDLTTSYKELAKDLNYTTVAEVIMEIINLIFLGVDEFEWKTPIFFKKEKFLILRLQNTSFYNIPAHFYFLCGFIQTQIEHFIKMDVNVQQIIEEEKLVDIKFQFNSNSKFS